MLDGMNDIPARTGDDVTATTLRSDAVNDRRSSASAPIRALGWVMAAWCLGFAAVNIALQVTGRFANGPYSELAAGLAVMDWIVVGLKLLGAAVAVLAANTRAATAARTVVIWGAFALLGLYSAGNIVELVGMLLADPGAIELRSLAYLGFFLAGAAGYGTLAVTYSRRTRAQRSHAILGVLGAPLVLGALLVARTRGAGGDGSAPDAVGARVRCPGATDSRSALRLHVLQLFLPPNPADRS